MRWLNYHHLYYFWRVAKQGSVTLASQELRLAQPTVSAQLKQLEATLGITLFDKVGRRLKVSESGQIVYRYAEEIFSLGSELFEVIEGKVAGRSQALKIGVCDVVPKTIAHRIIEPAYEQRPIPRIVCLEDNSERLLAALAIQEIELIISDSPIPPTARVKAFNHYLGECGVTLLAARDIADRYRRGFPRSLNGAPFLLPAPPAAVRRELDRWFSESGIMPEIRAEFQDSSLMKIFARSGAGILPLPDLVEKELAAEFGLSVVGRIPKITERFYLISAERKLRHPAVAHICESAQRLFAAGARRKRK